MADEDYGEWTDEQFTFTVTFENLVKGEQYSYKIGDTVQTDKIVGSSESAVTEKAVTIKGGQTVTFIGVPVNTVYTITEKTSFEDTESTSYETSLASSAFNIKTFFALFKIDALPISNTMMITYIKFSCCFPVTQLFFVHCFHYHDLKLLCVSLVWFSFRHKNAPFVRFLIGIFLLYHIV